MNSYRVSVICDETVWCECITAASNALEAFESSLSEGMLWLPNHAETHAVILNMDLNVIMRFEVLNNGNS